MNVMSNANAAFYFVDRHIGTPTANKPAFVEGREGGRQITYGELAAQSDLMADLLARRGLRREDRVAMLVLDTIEFPVIFWGTIKAGIIPVPLNTMLGTDVYRAILRDARPRALIVSSALLPMVAPLLDEIDDLVVMTIGESAGFPELNAELRQCKPTPMVTAASDEVAFWLYSSGSTGRPKGVLHVHSSLQATSDTYGAQVLGIGPDDVIFSAAKMFFAYGLGNAMSFPMSVGATTVLWDSRPTPDAMFAVMLRHNPTIFCGVPTLYAAMLAQIDGVRPAWADGIRLSLSAGEALPAEIGNNWAALVGSDILDGVGSTELLHIFLSNAPGNVEYGTSGIAVPGYDMKLVDDGGQTVETGEIGELIVRAPSAAEGYWNQRDKSRATFAGFWTHTGDKYTQRSDGRYIYCGRTDDLFKVSGIWVSPFEVEQALISHAAVLEAAVVAHQDDAGLDKPKAFVVLNAGMSGDPLADELKDLVKTAIGKWKYPRWIEIVDELPKTATGKIQRFKLRG